MFFNSDDQMKQLVKSRHWDKITKKLPHADKESKITLAAACANSTDENASYILINLLRDNDPDVLLETVKSLSLIGNNTAKTHLISLIQRLLQGNEPLEAAIRDAIEKTGKRK